MKLINKLLQPFAQKLQNLGGPLNRFFQEVTFLFMLPIDLAQDLTEEKEREGELANE